MPIDGVLIQRNQEIDAIAETRYFVEAGADCKKSMAATNDRLIRVVSIEVESTSGEDLCKDVSRGSYTLPRGSSYRDGESPLHRYLRCRARNSGTVPEFLAGR